MSESNGEQGAQTYRVLASVLDKKGLPEFLKGLGVTQARHRDCALQILSTGNTAKLLREQELSVTDVADYTESPEGIGGRVKTLHPRVHSSFLWRPGMEEDQTFLRALGATPIDMLIVNLYNFSGAVEKFEKSHKTVEDFAEVIENIDIGGPAMLRSADKGEPLVLTDPADYNDVLTSMDENEGVVDPNLEADLKTKVFDLTSTYDGMIKDFLNKYHDLYVEYLLAKRDILAGRREPFACWTKKH